MIVSQLILELCHYVCGKLYNYSCAYTWPYRDQSKCGWYFITPWNQFCRHKDGFAQKCFLLIPEQHFEGIYVVQEHSCLNKITLSETNNEKKKVKVTGNHFVQPFLAGEVSRWYGGQGLELKEREGKASSALQTQYITFSSAHALP